MGLAVWLVSLTAVTPPASTLTWVPLPLRSEAERAAGRPGGEGGVPIQAIAVSPADARRMLAGTGGSGIWLSEDGGRLWRPVREGLGATDVKALCFDPRQPDVVLAVIGLPGPRGLRVGRGEGIYRSADGGVSWTLVRRTDLASGGYGDRIAFDPRSSPASGSPCAVVHVATDREGILKTSDGGATWSRLALSAAQVSTVVLDPREGGRLYATTPDGLFLSSDGGGKFHRIGQELPIDAFEAPMGPNLALCAAEPDGLYLACREYGIFRSLDGGASWRPANGEGKGRLPLGADQDYVAVAVSPADPAVAFTSPLGACEGVAVWPLRTEDGGETWEAPGPVEAGTCFLPPKPRVCEAVAFDPGDPLRALAGFRGQVFETRDGGRAWRDRNDGIRGVGVAGPGAVAFDPARPSRLWIALGSAGVAETIDGGETFRLVADGAVARPWTAVARDPAPGADRLFAVAGPADRRRLWARRGAGSWEAVDGVEGDVGPVVFGSGGLVYAGAFRSRDGGRTWEGLDRRVCAVWPGDAATVYAIDRRGAVWALSISRDAGRTWAPLGPSIEAPIRCLAPEAARPDRVYAGTDAGVVVVEGDAVLEPGEAEGLPPDPLGGRAVAAVAADPSVPGLVYAGRAHPAGLSDGVYASRDGGRTWRRLGAGLPPALNVRAIAVDPREGTVVLSTDAGMWRLRGGARATSLGAREGAPGSRGT